LRLTPSLPTLSLSWPTNWSGYTLQNSPSLGPANWTTNTPPPYGLDGTHTNYLVTVSASSAAQFFRLKK